MLHLKNAWYMAAWASEIEEKNPIGRRIADQPIVIFRTEDGILAANTDMCPHRFAPLSLGTVTGDRIRCAYHGLEFDCRGKCVGNPVGTFIPKYAEIRCYAIEERDNIIWVWMGEFEDADPETIPDYSNHLDPDFHFIYGYMYVNANYELISDNLLDLTHVRFLHPDFGGEDFQPEQEVTHEDNEVRSKYKTVNFPNPEFGQILLPNGGAPVDEYDEIRWTMPSYLRLSSDYTPTGKPAEEGARNWSSHLLTAETIRTTHYFWASAVPKGTDFSDEDHRDALTKVFDEEDKPMINACQERMGDREFWSMKPLLLETDNAAVRARRLLKRRIDAEVKAEAET